MQAKVVAETSMSQQQRGLQRAWSRGNNAKKKNAQKQHNLFVLKTNK
jgi:hypothetical protein